MKKVMEHMVGGIRKAEKKQTARYRAAAISVSGVLAGILLLQILLGGSSSQLLRQSDESFVKQGLIHMDEQISMIRGSLTEASGGKRQYRLEDKNLVAPEPDPEKYGKADAAAELNWLLEDAASLLEGQTTLFSSETPIEKQFGVRYYFDETLLAISWKQAVDGSMYTFSEVKIAHPSQMRRFFAEGKYGSGLLYTTTEMSASVNAVVATSGDYYKYRNFGIVVNEGTVFRAKGELLDTCYIDADGNLLFTRAKEINGQEQVQQYVDKHNIRYSLSFGPVMIENGQLCVPNSYNSGEINQDYARSALGQLGPLHYVVVTANMEDPCYGVPTVRKFAENLWEMGIPTAYALDGGQTAALVMNDTLLNQVSYGSEREISDILYFATAIPDEMQKR